ncbi:TPA: putative bifunctional diguanylate cyclase/phosphodiesterase [Photobacterium damselae]
MNQEYTLFNNLQCPVWIFDIDNKKIIWANEKSLPLWEAKSLSELTNRDLSFDMSAAVEATLVDYKATFARGKTIKTWWSFTPHEVLKKYLCIFSGIPLSDGRIGMLVEVLANETTLRRDLAFSECSNLALLFNQSGQLVSTNAAFSHQFGECVNDLASFLGDIAQARQLLENAQQNRIVDQKLLCWTGQRHLWFHIEGKWLEEQQQLLLQLTNISPEREKLRQAKYNSEHDFLTGLMNRRGISSAIKISHHTKQPYSLLFLDLDGFKMINDTYGHAVGDRLLRAVSIRLRQVIQHRGLLARFGGDEFLIHVERRNITTPCAFAKEVITALNKPFHLKEVGELSIGCTVGTTNYPEDAQDIDTLVTQADMAMHRAKLRGRNCCHHFSPDMADALYRKMILRHHLTLALNANAFELYYQPIVDLKKAKLKGFEALIRWYDDDLGQISPAEFIPLAEETGQIVPLGQWILKTACRQLAEWKKKYDHSFIMSVNLSRAQLQTGLVQSVKACLDAYQIDPKQLALELTESTMLQDYSDAKQCLTELAELGIELYLDDFGTGYSSLSQLQDLPISTVKLDRSFVQGEHKGSQAIIEATQAICEKLDLKVVAEGVETEQQLDYLRQCNFDYCQGYYLGHPMPPQTIEERQFSLCHDFDINNPTIH